MDRHATVMTVALLLVTVCHTCVAQRVAIYRTTPRWGSIAGGTRVQIFGRGFSNNMAPDGNVVTIGGKYLCDVIPLHSTVTQIACKTRR